MRSVAALLLLLLSLAASAAVIHAWEKIDYDIFELVDSLRKDYPPSPATSPPEDGADADDATATPKDITFYEILQLTPDASLQDITKAHRKLSLTLHPDKNPDDPDAERIYTRIGAITNILKDPETRTRYDYYMRNGVPVWRGSGWYYARVRPGLGSVVVGLLVFASLVQYLLAWVGRWREMARWREEMAFRKARAPKRSVKKSKAVASAGSGVDSPGAIDDEDEAAVAIPRPRIVDMLLFRLVLLPVTLARMVFGKKAVPEADNESDDGASSSFKARRSVARRRGEPIMWSDD